MSYSFSNRDFTGLDILDAGEFINDMTIICSCFSQQKPDTRVFPDNVQNLILQYCNLDNVYIPAGVTVFECSTRRIIVQDGDDWLADENNNPIEKL